MMKTKIQKDTKKKMGTFQKLASIFILWKLRHLKNVYKLKARLLTSLDAIFHQESVRASLVENDRSSTESFMNFTKSGRCGDDQNGENETFRSCEMILMYFWSNFVCIS